MALLGFITSMIIGACGHDDDAPEKRDFVRLDTSGFTLNGAPFFPMAVNYILGYRWDGKELWCGSTIAYCQDRQDHFLPKDSSLLRFRADMELIKNMGFNTVRFVAVDHDQGRDQEGHGDSLGVKPDVTIDRDTVLLFSDQRTHALFFHAMDELLTIVDQVGLKAILLTWVIPDKPTTALFQAGMCDHFRDNTTILAYDLFNEPLYFDRLERPKEEVARISRQWRTLMRAHAPNQLLTIGYTGIREVFEFDPNIVDIDFISYHPYEYEPDQVVNEMYWYHKYVKLPWIIGETAIPADNDSVPYEEQLHFARRTLQQAYDCGAIGYSWWQYKDVRWNRFHSDFMGVVSLQGRTRTSPSGLIVEGTPKPMVQAIREFDPRKQRGPCVCESNYYNYSNHQGSKISGRLVDGSGAPIEGGVVLGWNEAWNHSYHTVSQADGRFELLGDFYFHHWMASAVERTMDRGDCFPNTARKDVHGIPTMELGTIVLKRLDEVPSWNRWDFLQPE